MKVVKVVLDIVIAGLFVSLLFASKTSFVFHEIIALTVVLLALVHILLNIKQIISAIKRIFSKKASKKISWMYLLNALLLIGILFVGITGIIHSRVVLPSPGFDPVIKVIHKWAAYALAALICVHLVLYFKTFVAFAKQIVAGLKTPVIQRAIGSVLVAVIIFGTANYYLITTIEKNIKAAILNLLSDSSPKPGTSTSKPSTSVSSPSSGTSTTDPTGTGEETTSGQPNTSTDNSNGNSGNTSTTPAISNPPMTFEEYVKGMYCGTCGYLYCPLSDPGCWTGIEVLNQQKAVYLERYG